MQAKGEKAMTMKDWIGKLDDFLRLSEKELLDNAGKISAEKAAAIADGEYERYRAEENKKMVSDFDKEVKKLDKEIKI